MWESPVSPWSLTIGAILTVLGGIPLLNSWGVLPFGLPAFLTSLIVTVAAYLLAGGGLFLLIDAWGEWGEHIGQVSLIIGLLVIALGLIQILGSFGVIPMLISLPIIAYNIIFVVEGVLLIIGAWMQF